MITLAVLAGAALILALALWTGRGGRPAPPARPRRVQDAIDETGQQVEATVFPIQGPPWRNVGRDDRAS